ncbi:MAG: efflux RND transporter periplasmic adaptor subunit [Planctomycetota bacterium]|nr:efflux RND transporter periplasmic adaptor subunit [Planctomycetota bacterium]
MSSHTQRSSVRRSWLSTVVLAGSFAVAAPAFAQGGPQASMVRLGDVKQESLAQLREVTGEVRALRRSALAAQEAGRVLEVLVDEGGRVEKDAPLVRLDAALAKIDVNRERASLAAARATLAEREADAAWATRDRERIEDMSKRGSANVSELDEKKTRESTTAARVAEAKASVALAEANVARAEEKLARMSIVAPFAGRIVKKKTEVGQWADAGTELLELVALDELEVRLSVPEQLAPSLAAADVSVRVRVPAIAGEVTGKVLAIVPDADPLSRVFPVRVLVKNEGERLRPGMSVTGLVPTGGTEQVLTVPKDAVLRDDAGEYVFINAGGTAAPARVRTLFAIGERLAVKAANLAPGAKVVTGGNERLFPGMPIADADAPPPAASSAPEAPSAGKTGT